MTSMEWLFLLDSDGQYPIDGLEPLLRRALFSDADMVVGTRAGKADSPLLRLGSTVSGLLTSLAMGRYEFDANCAAKVGRGSMLRELPLEARHLNYSSDVLLKAIEAGARVEQHPVRHRPRITGASSARPLRDGVARVVFVVYLLVRAWAMRLRVLDPDDRSRDSR